MESSILRSTKKILGLADEYTAYDLDVITHINTAFSILTDIGVGPVEGISIEDGTTKWEDLSLPTVQLSKVKTYIYLKTRSLFDPPTTSFLIEATNKQIQELEWRLNVNREALVAPLNGDG